MAMFWPACIGGRAVSAEVRDGASVEIDVEVEVEGEIKVKSSELFIFSISLGAYFSPFSAAQGEHQPHNYTKTTR